MSMDEATPGAAHRREVEQAQARGHHSPVRSNQWVDPVDQQDRYLEMLAEDIAGLEDELSYKRAEYERVRSWEPEPRVDARTFPSAGTDERESWAS